MILLIVVVTIVTFAFALVLQAFCQENKSGDRIFPYYFYIPNILSVVVIAGIFLQFISRRTEC